MKTLDDIEKLINSELIEQVVVYGDYKPYLVALLVLSDENETILDSIFTSP